jgi:hypothetical protein
MECCVIRIHIADLKIPNHSLYASIQYFDMGKSIKGKVVAVHALAVYRGSRYTTLLILNKANGQPQTPDTLPPGKEPPVPIKHKAKWAPEPVWMLWRKDESLAPVRNQTPDSPPFSLVTTLTTLSLF